MTATSDSPAAWVIQGRLWSTHANDWAEFQEPLHLPKYEHAIASTQPSAGEDVLDLGCGSGVFCRLAAGRGAAVTGIDASEGLIHRARARVPSGRFDVGDIHVLPYADDSFDVVTAFNSLQFTAGPARVLDEVRRVCRPQARLYILVWGRQERTELVAVMKALHPLAPARAPGGPGAFALSAPGVLEDLVQGSGFDVTQTGYFELPYEYPDQETALRAQASSAPAALAERTSGAAAVRDALVEALRPFRTTSGGYRLETEYRYLVATATA